MTQQYTPVTWQDETTSQQGTLINAERLNQMQTAHHYADGFEEVDAVPTADPSVAYHKIVYCTADNTFYRWDGTEWTKDIDDETKALLQQEIARATQADSQLNQRVDDEHDARVDAEAAIYDRITDEATELAQRITTEVSTRYTADTALGTRITNETSARETADTGLGNRITAEATARAEADTLLGGRIDTEQARAEAAEQANAQAIANTYTKAEADTLLAGKADTSTVQALDTRVGALETGLADTYNKSQTDTLLASKADDNAVVHKAGAETIPGAKTFTAPTTLQTGTSSYNLILQAKTVKITDNITAWTRLNQIQLMDAVGNAAGYIQNDMRPLDNVKTHEIVIGVTNEGGSASSIQIRKNATGDGWVEASSRGYNAGSAYSNDVATIGTLDAYTPMVRTTGNQVINGAKTFQSSLLGATVQLKTVDLDVTTPGTSTRYSNAIMWVDENNVAICKLWISQSATGQIKLGCDIKNSDNTWKFGQILAQGN